MEKFIQQAFILFNSIGSTTSRNDKEAYLKEGKDIREFKTLLERCYNPFIMFFVKKVPEVQATGTGFPCPDRFGEFLVLTNQLNKRELSGNAALDALADFFTRCTPDEQKWYTKVLQKDLKIGITDTTINKVFKGLIPTYSCMLAHPIAKGKYPKRYAVDAKLDGNRFNGFVPENGAPYGLSRNGLPIEGYTEIEEELAKLPKGYMYDGEIMAKSGSFSDTQKDVRKKGISDKKGTLYIFDAVKITEFEAGKGTTKYSDRLAFLHSLQDIIDDTNSLAIVAHTILTNSEDDLNILADIHAANLSRGYEGTMIKDLDAVYECKKGRAIQKLKDSYTIDLPVVGVTEGEKGTKYEGSLGALVVELKDTDILEQLPSEQHIFVPGGCFTVNVGSGFSDAKRRELWSNKEDIINRTIEIRFWNVTLNDDGEHSLRFPIFVRVRDDK